MKRKVRTKAVNRRVKLVPAAELYAKLCAQCRMGREPVRREIAPGVHMWVHDSVTACGAHDEREKAKHEAVVAAQRA